eukprot:GFKZ01005673.1.p1 GENE.GFKZ01005673.1~~GFKZ01005673.1.p1  ORF type:complete len:1134 (+),score=151.38 GFKZ01005673.1:429-3830(+)
MATSSADPFRPSKPSSSAMAASAAPDRIFIGAVRFWPFSSPSTDPTTTDYPSLYPPARKQFEKWAIANATKLQIPSHEPLPLPSPAAIRIFSVIRNHTCRASGLRLTLEINNPVPTVTFQISLDRTYLGMIAEVVRPSDALRHILWHLFRLSAKPSLTPNHSRDLCGFVGCSAACMPTTQEEQQAQFGLDRIFRECSLEAAKANKAPAPAKPPRGKLCSLVRLPEDVLFKIVSQLAPIDCIRLSSSDPRLFEFMKPIVPGLKLRLYPHQLMALGKMLKMESRKKRSVPMPMLKRIELQGSPDLVMAVDLVDGSILRLEKMPELSMPQGGLFCDEPGLGKTITSLSLVLKTLGRNPWPPEGKEIWTKEYTFGGVKRTLKYFQEEIGGRYNSFGDDAEQKMRTRRAKLFPFSQKEARRSSSRRVRPISYFQEGKGAGSVPTISAEPAYETVFLSHATLIVVPNVLTEHWLNQIRLHVEENRLALLHVASAADLPDSVEELATKHDVVLVPFEVVGQLANEMRDEAPLLMRVYFLRIIVDEGHRLSSSNVSQFSKACSRLRSEIKWVMTGTPTPSTLKSDIDHLHSLLTFIRDESYGFDKKAWQVGIREPYSQYRAHSLEMLRPLLRNVMIRADKSLLPSKLHIKSVLLDFTKESAKSYNWLVSLTRRNLITSDWFSEKHKESLLNRRNLKLAQITVQNLRYASCFGGTQDAIFTHGEVVETLDILYEKFRDKAGIDEEDRFEDPAMDWPLLSLRDIDDEEVLEKQRDLKERADMLEDLIDSGDGYTRLVKTLQNPTGGRAFVSHIYAGVLHDIATGFLKRKAHCARCHCFTAIPMITPCGHFLCENCVHLDRTRCTAQNCGVEYRLDKNGVPEDLIELQPSAYSPDGWVADWDNTKSAKMTYLIDRIKNLPMNEEWLPGESSPRLSRPKVIVHSAFTDHLNLASLELKNSELKESYVELWKNARDISAEQKKIKKASQFAINSISQFANDPTKSILLMNTRHGSVGLDLSFVEYIFLMEPVWDASVELQIISRAHRIGSKKDIYVERLVMRDSIEHDLLKQYDGQDPSGQPSLSGEKTLKDFSRHRAILRNIKPVIHGEERQKAIERSTKAKRRERSESPEPLVEGARRVRFKID